MQNENQSESRPEGQNKQYVVVLKVKHEEGIPVEETAKRQFKQFAEENDVTVEFIKKLSNGKK